MVNLSQISSASTTATGLANTILVNPQQNMGITPMGPSQSASILGLLSSNTSIFNPQTFLFHYNGEESVTLEADITDHFVEKNFAIQDHIARKPIYYSVTGYIGELNDVIPAILQPLKIAADSLSLIAPYTPALSVTAIEAYNAAFQAYQIAQNLALTALAAWTTLSGGTVQNKQQSAFTQFEAFFNQNQLFTVQTPWRIYNNMAIKTLKAIQDETTNAISTFEITFKQLNFSSTVTSSPPAPQGIGRNGLANSPQVSLGNNVLGGNVPPNYGDVGAT